jgi:DNA-binding response OmpR family regulator
MNQRLLIVEDDPDIAEKLKDLLELEGFVIEIAENGILALSRLDRSEEKPALILLDIMMPVMDGLQFCREQRQRPDLARIPTVIMTAGGKVEEKVKGLGIHSYLKKPLDVDLLLSTIRTALATCA